MKNLITLFASSIILLCSTMLQAQEDFLATPVCPDTVQNEFVKHLEAGTPANIIINVPAAAALVPISWGYSSSTTTACPGSFTNKLNGSTEQVESIEPPVGFITLTFNSPTGGAVSGKNVTLSSPSLTEGEYHFSLKLTYGGAARIKSFRFIVRKPLEMVMLLDRSGSMECDLDEAASGATWPGCATSNTGGGVDNKRWDILKSSINNFVNKLDGNHTLSTDLMSVVYFSGGTGVQGSITNDAMEFANITTFQLPLNAGQTPIYQEMSTAPPGGVPLARDGTSLGEGMYKTIVDRFNNTDGGGKRKVVLLFTDGEQNTGKWFNESGAIGTLGKLIQTSSTDASVLLNLNNAAIDDIEVYTAGVNLPGSAAESLLRNIADNHTPANPSYFSVMPGTESDFSSEMSLKAFNEIYNDFSPQCVRADKFTMNYNTTAQAIYPINKSVNRVIFEAYFDAPYANNANYTILKDGVDVTNKVSRKHMNDYIATFIFNIYEIPDFTSDGNWTFKVANSDDIFNNNKITLFATADDHNIEFNGYLDNGRIHVGQPLKANVSLSALGMPVTNAVVTATIIKPGEDLGNLLATTNINNLAPKTKEIGTCSAQKLDYLETNNPTALTKWKNLEQNTIQLVHQGKGIYSGTYNDVDVTGNYKIIYSAKATTGDIGQIERMKDQTIHVRFAPININLSARSIKSSKDNPSYYHTINFTPTYKAPDGSTRLLGPGYENAIALENTNVSHVDDECNGSYTIYANSNRKNPNVRIWVADDKVYSGPIQRFPELYIKRKWNVSAHGGITNPSGKMDSLYSSGSSAELDLAYRFHPRFSAELVGGYYGFKPNYQILGGTGYVKAHLNTNNPLQVFIGVGGGVYKPKDLDITSGYSIRLGAERFFGERFSLGLDLAGFFLPQPDLNFGIISGSIRYKL